MNLRDRIAQALTSSGQVRGRNAPYLNATPSTYRTQNTPMEEQLFQAWAAKNRVPVDNSPQSDYDMRGFYRGLMAGDPRAVSAVDPNDNRMHYPDVWKTPYHETFSRDSQWAAPIAPAWSPQDQLISPGGRIIFDDKAGGEP